MVMLASLLANLGQTQMQLATKALEPKWDKLDVVNGVKNTYFSSTPAMELVKGLGKMIALGGAVTLVLWGRLRELPKLATFSNEALLAEIVDLGWQVVLAALPIMLIIAAADYGYSVYKTTEQLKRTDKELRDEQKEAEGDPQLKAKRRQRAIQIARNVNLALIAQADVVVTNPTHYAVALRYDRERDAAPIVLVKGVDGLALKIRQRAREAGVPQVENRSLARALYAQSEMGQFIPEELYKPVAKVLAVVMQRRARSRRR
jgi:flagellar biosynthetic protein FlhB